MVQLAFPDAGGGANPPSLIDAQQNFVAFSACTEDMRQHVRAPSHLDRRDPGWRVLDVQNDRYLHWEREADHDLWRSVMEKDLCLYYWRQDYWLVAYSG
jgi:hypothetical protein